MKISHLSGNVKDALRFPKLVVGTLGNALCSFRSKAKVKPIQMLVKHEPYQDAFA